jgi:hypothetical protein
VGAPCSLAGDCPAGQHCDYTSRPPTCQLADARPADARLADASPPVPCTTDAGCPVEAPVCDLATQTCRGCTADRECGVDVCIEHLGTCVSASNVLYVAPTGTDAGTCSRAQPCLTLDHALSRVASSQRTIAMAEGTYTGSVAIKSSLGASSLTISGPDRDPARVVLTGTVLVENSTNDVAIEGVSIQVSGGRAVDNRGMLTLSRVAISGANTGLSSTSPDTLRVWDSAINDNLAVGIDVSQTTLELARTVVAGNGGGGIMVNNAAATIENCMIVNNGAAFAPFGGVRYQNLNGKPQVFRFNTVANNTSSLGATGVTCATDVTLESSIFTGAGNASLLSPACTATYSLFSTPPPAGAGNVMGDPAFVGPEDFHIGPTSAARDAADPAATLARDIDGDVRPQGLSRDIGADEIP